MTNESFVNAIVYGFDTILLRLVVEKRERIAYNGKGMPSDSGVFGVGSERRI